MSINGATITRCDGEKGGPGSFAIEDMDCVTWQVNVIQSKVHKGKLSGCRPVACMSHGYSAGDIQDDLINAVIDFIDEGEPIPGVEYIKVDDKVQAGIREILNSSESDLQLDVSPEQARSLHRVVRAMHDGHCPSCGHLGSSETFRQQVNQKHICPSCHFAIMDYEVEGALKVFQPHFSKSLDVFEEWRASIAKCNCRRDHFEYDAGHWPGCPRHIRQDE